MQVLITGGTGFVGRHLSAALLAEGANITVISAVAAEPSVPGVTRVSADIRDSALLRKIFADVQPREIYHLAAISSLPASRQDPRMLFEVNVTGTFNIFEAAAQLRPAPRLLNVSTGQVYGADHEEPIAESTPLRPSNPYAASKLMAELVALTWPSTAIEVVTTRAFNHSGPGQSPEFVLSSLAMQVAQAEAGLRDPVIHVGAIDIERDFMDVRDVVRAYRLLMRESRAGEVFNVCSGEPRSIQSALEILSSLSRVQLRFEVDPARLRSSDPRRIVGDCRKLRSATGWKSTIPFHDTLRDLLQWWRTEV